MANRVEGYCTEYPVEYKTSGGYLLRDELNVRPKNNGRSGTSYRGGDLHLSRNVVVQTGKGQLAERSRLTQWLVRVEYCV